MSFFNRCDPGDRTWRHDLFAFCMIAKLVMHWSREAQNRPGVFGFSEFTNFGDGWHLGDMVAK